MVLSTQTEGTAKKFGDERAVELIAEAGFDAVDFSMFCSYNQEFIFADDYKTYVKALKQTAINNGVYFNQAHAPFPSYKQDDEDYNKLILPRLVRSIEIAGILEVKNIVVHPVFFDKDKKERNLELYNYLLPYAKNNNVKIALENMWGHDNRRGYIVHNVCSSPEELSDYCDSLNSEWFTVCLDIGHCGLVGEDEARFINTLGNKRLTCLHLHDNDFKADFHKPPFTFKLDWSSILNALKNINYSGDVTLESDGFLGNMPKPLVPSALRFMHDTGRYIIAVLNGKENI